MAKASQNVHFLSYCFSSINGPRCADLSQLVPTEPRWGTILFPIFQLPPLCIYPLNYWAKEMGPLMAAWLECCQAAVPSQPFPELLVISHAQSDSQRQMVFKLNGCGRNLGAGLIGHAHTRGLPRLGHSFQRHSLWIAVSRSTTVETCHSTLTVSLNSTLF